MSLWEILAILVFVVVGGLIALSIAERGRVWRIRLAIAQRQGLTRSEFIQHFAAIPERVSASVYDYFSGGDATVTVSPDDSVVDVWNFDGDRFEEALDLILGEMKIPRKAADEALRQFPRNVLTVSELVDLLLFVDSCRNA